MKKKYRLLIIAVFLCVSVVCFTAGIAFMLFAATSDYRPEGTLGTFGYLDIEMRESIDGGSWTSEGHEWDEPFEPGDAIDKLVGVRNNSPGDVYVVVKARFTLTLEEEDPTYNGKDLGEVLSDILDLDIDKNILGLDIHEAWQYDNLEVYIDSGDDSAICEVLFYYGETADYTGLLPMAPGWARLFNGFIGDVPDLKSDVDAMLDFQIAFTAYAVQAQNIEAGTLTEEMFWANTFELN